MSDVEKKEPVCSVREVVLVVKGKELRLTLEEARELREVMNNVLAVPSYVVRGSGTNSTVTFCP